MKILWAKSDLLHPTTKGGHIRTLEMLRRMCRRHEIHYVAYSNEPDGEGVRRSPEYCSRCYPVPHFIPPRTSPAFWLQLASGLISKLPVSVGRYESHAMAKKLRELIAAENYDSIVCDFVFPAPNFSRLQDCVLFQHNLETLIIERQAAQARNPAAKAYLALQARRMFDYERLVCRSVRHVIAVSRQDAELMASRFGMQDISAVATGVDVEYFRRPPDAAGQKADDLVFIGSMDWLPNVDGVRYFVETVLPIIRRTRPDCSVAIVGRNPDAQIRALADRERLLRVTGTVPDVRPWLWGSGISIVPLRIGGGTRIKIYESMAAGTPVVSTTVGAEGLAIHPPDDIRIADDPQSFAAACLELLNSKELRAAQAEKASELVTLYGWDHIARQFETILEAHLLLH